MSANKLESQYLSTPVLCLSNRWCVQANTVLIIFSVLVGSACIRSPHTAIETGEIHNLNTKKVTTVSDETFSNVTSDINEVVPGAIATKNKTGYMFKELSDISKEFIDHSKTAYRVMDIGCAYGVSSIPVISYEKPEVFCVDSSKEHLDILASSIAPSQRKYFFPMVKAFPAETQFGDNQFDAIHISNVLHFIKANDMEDALAKCYSWLKPGGKLYLNIASIYWPSFEEFIPIYEERKAKGLRWAGEIVDAHKYIPKSFTKEERASKSPFLHLFKKGDLERELTNVGPRL